MPRTPPSNAAPASRFFFGKYISGQSAFLAAMLIAAVVVAGYILFAEMLGRASAAQSTLKLEDIPFDGAQAYAYLKQLCDFGPRPGGSQAIAAQQKFLIDYFQK